MLAQKDVKQWNIYTGNKTLTKDFNKKLTFFHLVIKNKLFIPLLWFIRKFFDKSLIKKIPKNLETKNLRIFNKSYDEALKWWVDVVIKETYNIKDTKKYLKENSSPDLLRLMKELMVTLSMMDSVYRPFFDKLVFNIGNNMIKEYHDSKDIKYLVFTGTSAFNIDYKLARDIIVGEVIGVLGKNNTVEFIKKKK